MRLCVHISDDSVQSNHTNQLQTTKKFELRCSGWVQEDTCHRVKRNRRQKIDHETAFEILDRYRLLICNNLPIITYDRCTEHHNDIQEEQEVDDGIQRHIGL